MFKYAKFGEAGSPVEMLQKMMTALEVDMLQRLRVQIDTRIRELQPMVREPSLDPFSILGVRTDATKEQVEKAFREKASKAHPDHGGSNEEMVKVNAAREAIFLFKGWRK